MTLGARLILISIHASAKEATNSNYIIRKIFYFNPRLREGGDCCVPYIQIRQKISIHASAKEATCTFFHYFKYFFISIHASAKEATATYCDTSAIMYISSLNNFFVRYF